MIDFQKVLIRLYCTKATIDKMSFFGYTEALNFSLNLIIIFYITTNAIFSGLLGLLSNWAQ